MKSMPADDAQRELERHALGRVQWLAAKLGYADALDAATEKWAIRGMVGVVAVVIVALGASTLFKESDEEKRLAVQRCRVAVHVEVYDGLVADMAKRHPEWSRESSERAAASWARDLERLRCPDPK